ncbi:MAG: putative oxidoreductase [Arenicella sp.]|jgi:uncharacterized oxidoreductase
MNLSNNKVLITGGGSGIGLEMAKRFLAAKSEVTVTGRSEAKLKAACDANPGMNYAVCDITNDDHLKALASDIEAKGGVNVLVNCAGIFNEVNYRDESASLEEQMQEVDIDFAGPIRTTHHFLPILKKQKNAALVNVSSGLAFVPISVAPVYCATKAGIHSWTRSLRNQIESQVKVFELMPPLTKTPMIKDEWDKFKPIPVAALVDGFAKGFEKNKYEICVGQSKQLRMMSKRAPKFIFKALNKSFS